MPATPPTVAAIMMVRNERRIVVSAIGHLLTTVGVDRIYVVDNGSHDGTPDILHRIARDTGRLVVESDPGAFRQDAVLTDLARRAASDGAGWVLPADADEFLWLRPGVTLASLCARDGIGGYRVPVRNFLQARIVRREWSGSLLTMGVSAIPAGSVADGQARVDSGEIPFVRINYPSKLLLRAAPALQITFGHHDATATAGPLVELAEGELLHAPIRAPDCLRRRADTGRRTEVVTPEPNQSWHVKRVAAMDAAARAAEWRRNAFAPLRPVQPGATRLDGRLARIGLRQLAFSRRYA